VRPLIVAIAIHLGISMSTLLLQAKLDEKPGDWTSDRLGYQVRVNLHGSFPQAYPPGDFVWDDLRAYNNEVSGFRVQVNRRAACIEIASVFLIG
jgi:hypothetical protein